MTKLQVSFSVFFAVVAGLLLQGQKAFAEASLLAPVMAVAPPAAAVGAPTRGSSILKTDSAEICTSVDGRYQLIRDFAQTSSFLVEFSRSPKTKPTIKQDFTYKREPGGFTQKTPVDADMFELMAEPFAGAPKARSQWKATYQEVFEGKITVFNDAGKSVGTIDVACNAAVVDFI